MDDRASGFEFRGNAKEWFGIWIVNLLLSIITIGIYSAWAKVRRNKYFYNNTYVEGRNFDYHATGKQILIGRLIVVAAVVVFNIIASKLPVLGLVLLLALVVIFPWLVVRSMTFNARMTSFSNVRFDFAGSVGQAFLVFIVYPILTALTAYLAFPILDRAVKRFSISNHKLGTASFNMEAPLGPFYKAFFVALAWVVIVGVLSFVLAGGSLEGIDRLFMDPEPDPLAMVALMVSFYAVFFLAFLPAAFLYAAMVRNHVYQNTTLDGGHRFTSNVSAMKLMWIAVSNVVVIVLTLGLMLPWAQVRMSKYLADHTGVVVGGSIDDFVGKQQEEGSALGDAYTDLEGIDVGLPI